MENTAIAAAAAPNEVSLFELSKNMPELLQKSEAALNSAQAAVSALPAVQDEPSKLKAFELLNKIKNAAETYKELRMPFTRGLDAIKKRFTTNENAFAELAGQVQTKLDIYTHAELKKQREAEAQAQAKLRAEQDRIESEAKINAELRRRIEAALSGIRERAGKLVHELSKDNYEDAKTKLSADPTWTKQLHDELLKCPGFAVWDKDLENRFNAIAAQQYETLKASYLNSAKSIMSETLAILDVALANKAEALKLQAIEEQRQAEAQAKINTEEQNRVEAEKAIAQLDVELPSQTVKAKVALKIKIDPANEAKAWMNIIAFWFTHCEDKSNLSKKTFAQCLTFAERAANSTGLLITGENIGIEYVEAVKAKK